MSGPRKGRHRRARKSRKRTGLPEVAPATFRQLARATAAAGARETIRAQLSDPAFSFAPFDLSRDLFAPEAEPVREQVRRRVAELVAAGHVVRLMFDGREVGRVYPPDAVPVAVVSDPVTV